MRQDSSIGRAAGKAGWLATLAALFLVSIQAAEPRFRSVTFNEFGDVVLQADVTAGKRYRLESTSTMTSWFASGTKTADSAQIEFVQLTSSNLPHQVFRLREVNETGVLNDNFADAAPLVGTNGVVTGSNAGAGAEAGEPDHSWLDPGKNSVWWKWVAPSSGRASLSLAGTYFETVLAVYTGSSPANLQPVAKARRITKIISFDAVAGRSYYVAVAGLEGFSGDIRLAYRIVPVAPAAAPVSVSGFSMFMDETSNPFYAFSVLDFAPDGKSWKLTDNENTNVIGSGAVLDYFPLDSLALVQLSQPNGGETDILDYELNFDSPTTGSYSYNMYGIPAGSGRFSNFRDMRGHLAPPSLENTSLYIIRRQTSTGPAGQQHFITLDWEGAFHDSDGEEHASGSYEYTPNGDTAVVKVTYSAPLDFAGDQHTMTLSFVTPTKGTFAGQYRRNDGTLIEILGEFSLDFFQ